MSVHEQLPARALLDTLEVAQLLNLGLSKTKELIYQGEIRSIKIGRRRLVPRDALDEYIARLTA